MNLQSPKTTKVLGLLGMLVLVAASWFLVLGPQAAGLSETQAAVVETRDQSDLLRGQLDVLQTQERELPETRVRDRALGELFPRTADQPGLFREVGRAATGAGIPPAKVTTVAPTAPTLGGETTDGVALPTEAANSDLARQTVIITVEADHTRTQRLLDNLEDMPRAYLVSSLTLGTGTTPGSFLTTVTGDMFVMSPAPRP